MRRFGELLGGDEGNVVWWFGGFLDAYNRHSWKEVAAVYTPDFVLTDRRPAGWGEVHGGERIAEIVSGLAKLAPDVRVDLVEVLALDGPVLLVGHAHRGHDVNGGEVEIALVNLVVCREDGVVTSDLFPPDAEQAMEAFERAARAAPPAPAGGEVGGVLGQWLRAFNERDWAAAARCLHPEFVFVDRRAVLAPRPLDAEGFVALGREVTGQVPDGRFTMEPASDGGDRTTGRAHFAGTPANRAGHVEFSYAYLVEVADGRLRRFELSDEEAGRP
jgi:ketosteroid isomerase-like protein